MGLKKLNRDSEYAVAADSIDIRGWRLYDGTGQELGVVEGLLFDPAAMAVRYAVVDSWSRRVLLPVADVDIDREARRVVARDYNGARIAALPPFDEAAIAAEEQADAARDARTQGRARRRHPFDLLYGLTASERDEPCDEDLTVEPRKLASSDQVVIRRNVHHDSVTFTSSELSAEEMSQARRAAERRPARPDSPRIEDDV